MKNSIITLVVAATVIAPLAAYAQDVTRRQMNRLITNADRYGYALTSQYYQGSLDRQRTVEVDVRLSTDRQMIAAVCDQDCSDIDLTVYEMDGREIGSDRSDDDQPMVFVPSGHAGTHRVRVSMPSCRVNPCRYELAVFTR